MILKYFKLSINFISRHHGGKGTYTGLPLWTTIEGCDGSLTYYEL